MPIMCGTAETEVKGIYAWKWACLFCQLVGLGSAESAYLGVRQGLGFVIITSVQHRLRVSPVVKLRVGTGVSEGFSVFLLHPQLFSHPCMPALHPW